MKILLNCYACSPYHGSEPGMGWNFVKYLSTIHEVHVITEQDEFKDDIERYIKEHPSEAYHYHFYYIKRTHWNTLRKIWPPSYYWTYKAWQRKALSLAKELDFKENFDIIHQLNMVGFRECGYLYKLDKPLVWGPTGGMHISPWCLLPHIGLYGMIYYGLRNIINIWQMYTHIRPHIMAKKCNAIIAATKDSQDAIKRLWGKESVIIPEVGLSTGAIEPQIKSRKGKLKIVWSGQHTPAKGLNFLISALSLSDNKDNIELHVLGIGIYTNKWKRLCKKLNLNNVFWYGWVDRDIAIKTMQQCHVFCITSLADLTSSVLLEALSYGLPVVSPDCFGFSNTITESCGIKIKIRNKKQYIEDYKKSIDLLCQNEDLRLKLSKGAFIRAKEFSWEKKIEKLDVIYNNVVNKSYSI